MLYECAQSNVSIRKGSIIIHGKQDWKEVFSCWERRQLYVTHTTGKENERKFFVWSENTSFFYYIVLWRIPVSHTEIMCRLASFGEIYISCSNTIQPPILTKDRKIKELKTVRKQEKGVTPRLAGKFIMQSKSVVCGGFLTQDKGWEKLKGTRVCCGDYGVHQTVTMNTQPA